MIGQDPRQAYQDAHKHADTDNETDAIHHTLGYGPNQAAPGSHSHGSTVHDHDATYSPVGHTHPATVWPAFSAYKNTSFNTAHGWQVVTSWTESLDNLANFNPTTGQFTVPVGQGGSYLIQGGATFQTFATDIRRMIQIETTSGKNLVREDTTASGYVSYAIAREAVLAEGEVLQMALYQNSGAALAVRGDFGDVFFSIRRVQ